MQPHSLKLSPESDLINSIKEYSLSNNLYGYVSGAVSYTHLTLPTMRTV